MSEARELPDEFGDTTRMYTSRLGRRAHLIRRNLYDSRVSVCGRFPWPDEWLGTGSQAEYERAASLPLCKLCQRKATP